jgi:hypothetical protein
MGLMNDEYEGKVTGERSEDDAVDDGQKISCTVTGHGVDWR